MLQVLRIASAWLQHCHVYTDAPNRSWMYLSSGSRCSVAANGGQENGERKTKRTGSMRYDWKSLLLCGFSIALPVSCPEGKVASVKGVRWSTMLLQSIHSLEGKSKKNITLLLQQSLARCSLGRAKRVLLP